MIYETMKVTYSKTFSRLDFVTNRIIHALTIILMGQICVQRSVFNPQNDIFNVQRSCFFFRKSNSSEIYLLQDSFN